LVPERVKLCFSLARLFVTTGVEFEPKRILAALLNVTLSGALIPRPKARPSQ